MGKLYICGTPIGNLEDVTIRLLKTLRQVDLIACEDTRQTLKLLNRYKIKKPLLSYHKYSSREKEEYILDEVERGKNVALVSDAGMPAISDPGEFLIKKAVEKGIEIEVIPGPSALVAALCVSGLDSRSFIFQGFLPAKRGQRQEVLAELKTRKQTSIFFEAPHRLRDTLLDLQEIVGVDRKIVVARELTKKHQEIKRGSAATLYEFYREHAPRGEICLLISGSDDKEEKEIDLEAIAGEIDLLLMKGMEKNKAFKTKAREYKINKSIIYNYYHYRNM